MIEINLLPKDYLKGSSNLSLGKSGLYLVAGAVAVVVLLVGVTFYQVNQISDLEANIDRANERAAMLQKDIRVVDALTDVKNKIGRRMEAVERLDRHRSVWVRILEDVAGNVPEFVWLAGFTEVKRAAAPAETAPKPNSSSGKKETVAAAPVRDTLPQFRPVEVEGYAFTLNSLAAFMINLMRSDYFDAVELSKSEEMVFNGSSNDKAYNFVVSCNVHFLSDEDLATVASVDGPDEFNEADFEEAEPTVTAAAEPENSQTSQE